jgi:hypothetical protein
LKASPRICLILALFTLGKAESPGRVSPPDEYQLKAVFLYNFAQFTEWPTNAFAGADAPLVIGVLGDSPLNSNLETTVRGEKIKNRPLIVEHYRRVDEIRNCHILFVSPSESPNSKRILTAVQGRAILTVGDTEGFSQKGGMIRFLTEAKHIHLRVNVEAAKAARLVISSKLLRQAEIVETASE